VVAGIFAGKRVLSLIPQKLFEELALGFAGLAALRLILV
jgi:hypothetical protein